MNLVSKSILDKLRRCVEESKEITIYTSGYIIDGVPVELKEEEDNPMLTTVVIQYEDEVECFKSVHEEESTVINRAGFKFTEAEIYVRDISSLLIDKSVCLQETYHKDFFNEHYGQNSGTEAEADLDA